MKYHPRLRSLLTSLSLVLLTVATAAPDRDLKTTPVMRLETRTLVQLLEYIPYNKGAVSSDDYPQLISDYMAELDPQRLFFTGKDEQSFRAVYGPRIETDLAYLGNIDAAFDIFKVYEQRVTTRISWLLNELNRDYDFTKDEAYQPDRSKNPFPADQAEADELWHRLIKYEIIRDLVDKKPLEEARTTVRKRYERMLKNVGDIEASEMQEMFLSCLMRMYDPHSSYLSADTMQDFYIQMKLSLTGIGAVLSMEDDGYCMVREVVPGGPAYASKQIGMNDKIVAVQQGDGENIDVVGMKLRRIVDMIRGEKGTRVTLTILPHDAVDATKTRKVAIIRDVIKLDTARAAASIYDVPATDGQPAVPVGVITLNSFYGPPDEASSAENQNAATQDVAELIGKLKQEGIKALVIDLRRNGGGLLPEAVDLTGLFIPTGPVVQERDFQGQITVDRDTDPTVAYAGPLAVLTSRFSASASEIFAGALQNYGRAVIIGDSSTHGKGTVQQIMEMQRYMPRLSQNSNDTGAAKVTIRKFYLPNGASTQMKGIIPDITLPSINDFLPIGETDLPHALKWDEIKSTTFNGHALPPTVIQPLLEASHARQDSLEEFSYLKKSIDWFKERQEQKSITLNLEKRVARKQADDDFKQEMDAERDRLAETNYAVREIKLDSVLKTEAENPKEPVVAVKAADPDAPETDAESKLDVHLRETLRVVTDAMRMKMDPAYWADGHEPVAATDNLHKG